MPTQKNKPPRIVSPADELRFLMDVTRRGQAEYVPRLKSALDSHAETWRSYGDLDSETRESWINLICGNDLAKRECLGRRIAAMRGELAGLSPSPLEKLLVERVIASWLQVNHADAVVARSADVDLKQSEFALKQQDAAYKRHFAATKELATVRTLLSAAVKVSLVAAQIVTAGPSQEETGQGKEIGLETRSSEASECVTSGGDGGVDQPADVIAFERPHRPPGRGDKGCISRRTEGMTTS